MWVCVLGGGGLLLLLLPMMLVDDPWLDEVCACG